jgi:hypothetical protein
MGPVIADVGNHGRVGGWDKAQALSFQDSRRSDIAASITELQNLVLSTAGMENFLQELAELIGWRGTSRRSCDGVHPAR